MKTVPVALALLIAASFPALAQDVAKAPPPGEFKAVSSLVKLPDFLPGMGQLFVDPATLNRAACTKRIDCCVASRRNSHAPG